jgi:hypothetical protein
LDLVYSFSILGRSVDVQKLVIDEPVIRVRSTGSAAAPKAAAPEKAVVSQPPSEAPVQLALHDFAVNGLELELDQKGPEGAIQAKVHGLSLHLAMEWVRRDFRLSGDFALGDPIPVTYDGPGTRAQVMLSGAGKWSLAAESQGAEWALKSTDSRIRLSAGPLTIEQSAAGKPPARYRVGELAYELASRLAQDGGLELETRYEGKGLEARPALARPVSLDASSRLHLDRAFKKFDWRSELSLAGIRLLEGTGSGEAGAAPGFSTEGKLKLSADPRLGKELSGAAALARTGAIDTELGFRVQTQGSTGFGSLIEALPALSRLPIAADLELVTRQDARSGKTPVRFAPVQVTAKVNRDPGPQTAHVELALDAPSVQAPPLLKPCALGARGQVDWAGAQGALDASGTIQLQKAEALSLKSHTILKDGIQSKVSALLTIGDYLEGLVSRRSLKGFGRWSMASELELDKGSDRMEEKGTVTVTQVAAPGELSISLPEPFRISHRVSIDPVKTDGELTAELPLLEAQRFGKMVGTRFSASVHTPQAAMGKDLDLSMDLKQEDIVFAEAFAKKAPRLAGMELSARGRLRGGDALELDSFSGTIGRSLLKLTADASGKLRSKDFEAKGLVAVSFPEDFPKLGPADVHGTIEVPWTLSMVQGKEIDLDGTAFIERLSALVPAGGVSGVSGRIPFSEKLVFDGKHVHFAHLINQNPFERVDFERVRPLIEGASQVRFDELHWEEKSYGPLVAYFSLKQNMLQAQQADMNIGPGRVYGEMFLNAYPANLQFGLLSRITNLDLEQVLPARYLKNVASGDKSVSGRSGIVVDLNKRTVDGRVDITEISEAALDMLINVMDPTFENERMNQTRHYLELGAPENVQIELAQGYANTKTRIRTKAGVISVDARMPISQRLASATADVMKKTQEGPLK